MCNYRLIYQEVKGFFAKPKSNPNFQPQSIQIDPEYNKDLTNNQLNYAIISEISHQNESAPVTLQPLKLMPQKLNEEPVLLTQLEQIVDQNTEIKVIENDENILEFPEVKNLAKRSLSVESICLEDLNLTEPPDSEDYNIVSFDYDPDSYTQLYPLNDKRLGKQARQILTPRISSDTIKNIKNFEELGEGSFGVIKFCKLDIYSRRKDSDLKTPYRVDSKLVAAKKLNEQHLKNRYDINLFINEICILKHCRHENILKYIGIVFKSHQKFYLVTEYCDGKNLFKWFRQDWKTTNFFYVNEYTLDIAKGLEYLHNDNILHRDLKSMNILMFRNDNKNKSIRNWVLKIADFGAAYSKEFGYKKILKNDFALKFNFGTLNYMAPEIQNFTDSPLPYTTKVDVYAFGCIMSEFLSGSYPMAGFSTEKLLEKAKEGKLFLNNLLVRSDSAKIYQEWMWKCTSFNVDDRPEIKDVVNTLKQIKHYFNMMEDRTQRCSIDRNKMKNITRNSSKTSLNKMNLN
ncbi:unnamed protein product [Brachionus calyciflorus]|uniref:Protein kinase domain-containing protein n=1 Tax=Brachionus calyciflorus TaxID=104777 RepID=A0A813M3C2_9BILA|nr:unnamed protein product [Brachionus calyciflorus]